MKNRRDNPYRKAMIEAWKELCTQQAIEIKFKSDGTSVFEDEDMVMFLSGYILATHDFYKKNERRK